jgi:putative transcriptional regulator
MSGYLQNHFLIAMPSLADSFFYRSVVYLCEHDENGAMGLIINRPTKVMLTELLSHLEIEHPTEYTDKTPVLFGGPVQKGQGLVIHDQKDGDWRSTLPLSEEIMLTSSTDILEALGTEHGPERSLVTLGYSGWEAGQLEEELAENSWLTVPANLELLFETPADQRWEAAAALLGIDIHLMSQHSGRA